MICDDCGEQCFNDDICETCGAMLFFTGTEDECSSLQLPHE